MILKDYLLALQDMIEQNPKILNYPLCYSIDDEGNEYKIVINTPCLCAIEKDNDWRMDLLGFQGGDSILEKDLNAICIN